MQDLADSLNGQLDVHAMDGSSSQCLPPSCLVQHRSRVPSLLHSANGNSSANAHQQPLIPSHSHINGLPRIQLQLQKPQWDCDSPFTSCICNTECMPAMVVDAA